MAAIIKKEDILWEDRQIIVCRKPAGLAVQTAGASTMDLVSMIKNYLHSPYLGLVHRLDQPVEGLLVFAKTKQAAAELSRQNREHFMGKRYYALTLGSEGDAGERSSRTEQFQLEKFQTGNSCIEKSQIEGSQTEGSQAGNSQIVESRIKESCWYVLEDFLKKEERGNHSRVVSEGETGGKRARLQYQKVQELESENGTIQLLRIELETGRHHQIRVQMAYHGLPLLGDRKYGSEEAVKAGIRYGIRDVALCCYELEFHHPVTKKKMCFSLQPSWELFSSEFRVSPAIN